MIERSSLARIGTFGKPHGINGEINLSVDADLDLRDLSCIVIDVDGINVPFFFSSVRERGNGSYLVMIDGIASDRDVAWLVNKQVYGLVDEVREVSDYGNDGEEGFYAEDLIGYRVVTDDNLLTGTVDDIDDSTDNVLFIILTDEGRRIMVPVADEFITDIDTDNKIMKMQLPDGLINL